MRKTPATTPDLSPRQHLSRLIKWMSTDVYEKDHLIAVALLCAVAGENVFILGPPGTAKSMVAARLKGVFKGGRAFDYLMSRFSTPDEIFGPVSISRLKEHDRYERLTAGYLPDAEVVFLDEIWKAGPSIQNTLLTAINEHVFYNGGRPEPIPMKVLIAASNELPAQDEGLEALWDRFLMRMISNCIDSEASFMKMLTSTRSPLSPLPADLLITEELYAAWQAAASQVVMSEQVRDAILYARTRLRRLEADDGQKMRFYVSDRRWRKAFHLMQASAFLNGRDTVDLSDFLLLVHALWNDVEAIPAIVETVTESITACVTNAVAEIESAIRQSLKSSDKKPSPTAPPPHEQKEPKIYDYFYYKLDGHPDGDVFFSKWDYSTLTEASRRGVKYLDTARNKLMVRALSPGADFDAAGQNAVNVTAVSIRRAPAGIYIDNILYPFSTGESSAARQPEGGIKKLKDMPVYQRVAAMEQMIAKTTAQWDETVKALRAEPNMFLSRDDRSLIDKAVKQADSELKTLTVRLNNLRSML